MLVGMEKLSTKGADWVNGVRDLLFPPVCLFCKEAGQQTIGCCANCLQQISVYSHTTCLRCGIALPESMAPGPCGSCLTHPPAQAQTHSLYDYRGSVRDAILEWKLQGHDAAVVWLVQAAIPKLRELIDQHALLLPVPMPLSRMRKHGQHHSANLCRLLADDLGCGWDWRILRRMGEQVRQSTLSGSARKKNLRKAFALATDYQRCWSEKFPAPRSVWIVDDVLTTGSTLHFASKASLKLGIEVNVLSLARTPYRG